MMRSLPRPESGSGGLSRNAFSQSLPGGLLLGAAGSRPTSSGSTRRAAVGDTRRPPSRGELQRPLSRGNSSQFSREFRVPSGDLRPISHEGSLGNSPERFSESGWASASLPSMDFHAGTEGLKRRNRVTALSVSGDTNVLNRPRGTRSGLVVQHPGWEPGPGGRAHSASSSASGGIRPTSSKLSKDKFKSVGDRPFSTEEVHQTSFFKRVPSKNLRRVRPVADSFQSGDSDLGGSGRQGHKRSEEQPLSKAQQRPQHQDVRAPLLATKFRLNLYEVKNILDEFDKTGKRNGDNDEESVMTLAQFKGFLCRVFEVPSVPDDVVGNAYEACQGDKCVVTIEAFLQWYTINMFTIVNLLNADLDTIAGNELIYTLAKKHQVPTMTIDKVKSKFDLYDSDGSGEIEYEEFKYLFTVLLKVKSERDLSQDRAMRAWKEIDVDRSGGVDFSEFTEWYLKYLYSSEDDDSTRGPAEAFYDSYNPVVQRHQVLEKAFMSQEQESVEEH